MGERIEGSFVKKKVFLAYVVSVSSVEVKAHNEQEAAQVAAKKVRARLQGTDSMDNVYIPKVQVFEGGFEGGVDEKDLDRATENVKSWLQSAVRPEDVEEVKDETNNKPE